MKFFCSCKCNTIIVYRNPFWFCTECGKIMHDNLKDIMKYGLLLFKEELKEIKQERIKQERMKEKERNGRN